MIEFCETQLTPRFLRHDRNGAAMSAAMAAGLFRMTQDIRRALDEMHDIDKMPEWRLDELAWEYNAVYDYSADVDAKRAVIRHAAPTSQLFGTAQLVQQLVDDLFGDGVVEEWWEYGGDPYHFRVRTGNVEDGTREADKLRALVMRTKNVRSVMDPIAFETDLPGATLFAGGHVMHVYHLAMGTEE